MKRDGPGRENQFCSLVVVNHICQKSSFQFLSSSVCMFVCVCFFLFWGGFGLQLEVQFEALSNILHVSFANHQVARREGSMGQCNENRSLLMARLHMNL